MSAPESSTMNVEQFRGFALGGNWKYVFAAYEQDSDYHKIRVNKSRGTALHLAVNEGKLDHVKSLVGAILKHEGRGGVRDDSALRLTNENGDTPLHLAASRGFIAICMCIIGKNWERKDLIRVRNKEGETPLFRAVLSCKRKTFVYLYKIVSKDLDVPLADNNGNTILHHAIWREFLDLAIIINHCYPDLVESRNENGLTPLKVLASIPSAFESGCNLPWWMQILHRTIPANDLDAAKAIELYLKKVEKKVENNEKDEYIVNIHSEHEETKTENYGERITRLVNNVVRLAIKLLSFSGLRVTAEDLKEAQKIKEKHQWGPQLLKIFMKILPVSGTEYTGVNPFMTIDNGVSNLEQVFITEEELESIGREMKYEEESAYLIAARNGITEIESALWSKIPSVVHETNSRNENVLHVAVKHKRVHVVERLRKELDRKFFKSLTLEMDNEGNTVLHLATATSNSESTWHISGPGTEIMWDIKWYEYIRDLVPEHFIYRQNKHNQTAWQNYEEIHNKKVKDCTENLKDLSNSASVVAGLIAGVSFATSSSLPGGNGEDGKPIFSGETAFDVFAIASLFGLVFSLSSLAMFLAILTSSKKARDFRISLPLKLIFGLGSLIVSVVSMLVSFAAAHFFVLDEKFKIILFPVYVATCMPLIIYTVLQLPFYADLVRTIFKKVPWAHRNHQDSLSVPASSSP